MSAYLVYARRSVTDEAKSRRYRELVVPQVRAFGGEFLTAGAAVQALEGQYDPKSITLIRFKSSEDLMKWYESPEYAPLLQMRLESSSGELFIFDGN